MDSESLVKEWFLKWTTGDFKTLPISENFSHTSPFGTIQGKIAYLDLVSKNKDKFLNYTFKIIDGLYLPHKACVRYTAHQGEAFKLDVSEWYYISNGKINQIFAYYHIGEIIEDRQLK